MDSGAGCTLHKGAPYTPQTMKIRKFITKILPKAVKMFSVIISMTAFQQKCLGEEVPLKNYTKVPPGLVAIVFLAWMGI